MENVRIWYINCTSRVLIKIFFNILYRLLFLMLFFLNFWLWIYHSPSAISPSVFFGLFFLWLIISVPLTFFGSFIGFKNQIIQSPVKINHIPRFIPQQVFV